MNNRFSGTNKGFRRKSERERLFFFAAAGLAFSLLIITLVVFQFRSDVEAVQKNTKDNQVPQKLGTVIVYGVERTVNEGTKLSDATIKELYWNYNQVPDGAIRDLSELKSMYANENLRPNVPLVRSMLSAQPIQKSLPVAKGFRAVTIPVDAISGIEGLLKPGSRVDVTLTYYEQGELTTKAIIQNVRVLAYGGVTNPTTIGLGAPARVAPTATLEVTPEDGMKITTSKKLGTLSLMMRGDDASPMTNTEVTETDVGGNKKKRDEIKGSVCGRAIVGGEEVLIPCGAGEPLSRLDRDQLP